MGRPQQVSEGHRESARENPTMQPFHGVLSPGICFASGHCVVLNNYTSTPTSIGAIDEVWMVTPEGERLLYADPPEAGPIIETYHDFDRTRGAEITWGQANEDSVEVDIDAEDGTTFTLRADLGVSRKIRLLNAMMTLTPRPIVRTSVGQRVITLSFRQLIETNGLKIAGRTETQEPYRVEADNMRAVTSADAMVDGEDLGEVGPPDRLIEFGDHSVPNEPLIVFGDIYLRPPRE